MKNIYWIALAVAATLTLSFTELSCDSWYPLQSGREWELHEYDAKDKLTGKVNSRVLSTKDIAGGTEAEISMRVTDSKDKPVSENTYTMFCINGSIQLDMKMFMPEQQLEAFKDMEMTITGDDLEFPASLNVGDVLRDGIMQLAFKSNGMDFGTITVKIHNRKVEKQETLTVPAGTFDCYKVTEEFESNVSMMGMEIPMNMKNSQWIHHGAGTVRTETFDKNGKLEGYSVLGVLK